MTWFISEPTSAEESDTPQAPPVAFGDPCEDSRGGSHLP
jgi:hypothetical protein